MSHDQSQPMELEEGQADPAMNDDKMEVDLYPPAGGTGASFLGQAQSNPSDFSHQPPPGQLSHNRLDRNPPSEHPFLPEFKDPPAGGAGAQHSNLSPGFIPDAQTNSGQSGNVIVSQPTAINPPQQSISDLHLEESRGGDEGPAPSSLHPKRPQEEEEEEEEVLIISPLDLGEFTIFVNWSEAFPKKWGSSLEKALQTWLSGWQEKPSIHSLRPYEDQRWSRVEITPSSVLGDLKAVKPVTLKLKPSNMEVTAEIYLETPRSVLESKSSSALENSEQPHEVKSEDPASAPRPPPNTLDSFTVPLHQYWYLIHAYREELQQIEKKHGVSFYAEVSVSIKPSSSSSPVSGASKEFKELVGECVEAYSEADVSHHSMDSDIMKSIMHTIQSQKEKMMLTRSAKNCVVIGPKRYTERINEESKQERSSKEKQRPKEFPPMHRSALDTQEPLPLKLDEVLWDLMKLSYEEQLNTLKVKYGVIFSEEKGPGNQIKVEARPSGGLERHAIRALTRLYQKLASSVMICDLMNPKDEADVISVMHDMRRSFCVVSSRSGKCWRLAGLPEHLGPALSELEKRLKRNVFDSKMRSRVGYSGNVPHARGIPSDWVKDVDFNGDKMEETYENLNTLKEKPRPGIKEAPPAEEDNCVICMDSFTNKEKLKCGHEFCKECLKQSVESLGPLCPVCKKVFGRIIGNQPDGTMTIKNRRAPLPGFPNCGSFEILYYIPGGVQTEKHPQPGKHFSGTSRQAYLPDNPEGRQVLALLQRAFDQKLIFTVGTSTTSGMGNTVTWNDIHHKTNTDGGPERYGYPDPDYLKRVKDELKAKGIE
ncbi:hypothetical protein DNTS_008290 [Danionella cerebrum]|uniref:E3 ubiquitin-protein ligase n=1 Tax=Danionella cerebrum TaxID=2873325 RepID=A0A553R6I9_9TELE|nr:hypothetical protein DNTS_008290 [Danionella translucida]